MGVSSRNGCVRDSVDCFGRNLVEGKNLYNCCLNRKNAHFVKLATYLLTIAYNKLRVSAFDEEVSVRKMLMQSNGWELKQNASCLLPLRPLSMYSKCKSICMYSIVGLHENLRSEHSNLLNA